MEAQLYLYMFVYAINKFCYLRHIFSSVEIGRFTKLVPLPLKSVSNGNHSKMRVT